MKHINTFESYRVTDSHVLSDFQQEFLNKYVNGTWSINEKGLVDVDGSVFIQGLDIEELPVKFATVKHDFTIGRCDNLKNLFGAPSIVNENFSCTNCKSLTSLSGSPKKVENFRCYGCTSLLTLEGGPVEVKGTYDCSYCPSIVNLAGTPESVKFFDCSQCDSLKTLSGPITNVKNFDCSYCKKLKSVAEAPIAYNLYAYEMKNCNNLPDSEKTIIEQHPELIIVWLQSGLSAEVFLYKNRGLISSKDVLG